MNNKCNNCGKFLTCDKKECKKITFVEAEIIEKPKRRRRKQMNNIDLEEIAKRFKMLILIYIVFIIGFFVGYWCKNTEYEDQINRQAIEIVDLKEQLHRERMGIK